MMDDERQVKLRYTAVYYGSLSSFKRIGKSLKIAHRCHRRDRAV